MNTKCIDNGTNAHLSINKVTRVLYSDKSDSSKSVTETWGYVPV